MSFKDIKGQDKPIEILRQHIRQSRLSCGYLFTGPEGVGKKMIARTLAKALNCENGTLDSCDRCASCLRIEKGQHPDVYLINAAVAVNINAEQNKSERGDSDAIKISHIRQLQKDISLKPYEAKLKVFIIDDAHNLTPEASSALLKILEEPPDKSLIILVSAKPAGLFKTIISRCQVLKFYPLARSKLGELLSKDYGLDANLAHFLAYFCEGRLGRALSLRNTDILRQKNMIIDALMFSHRSGLADLPIKNREEVRSYLNILTSWIRDLYLIKIGTPYQELINFDRKNDLLKSMPRFTFTDLDEMLNYVSDSISYLGQNINTKLLLANLSEAISYGARRAT